MTASQAGVTCASPQEVKALQAAALEQQLAAAAQSCHLSADYGLFVARFRGPIVRSDRAVRAFFQHRKNSEGYDAYKARVAQDASLRSLHEPQFCRNAKTVFDMALGRGGAGKSPAMVQTGYEHCRMPATPRVVTTTTAAAHALTLADPIPIPLPRVLHVLALAPTPHPHHAAPLAKTVVPAPAPRAASVAPPRVVEAAIPAARTAPLAMQKEPEHTETGPAPFATIERPRWRAVGRREASADDAGSSDPDDPYGMGGNIPNAYRPGSHWVGEELRDDDPSVQKRPSPMVMGPDGHWYVLIGHQDTWQRD